MIDFVLLSLFFTSLAVREALVVPKEGFLLRALLVFAAEVALVLRCRWTEL